MITELKRLRQKDHDFEANLGYIGRIFLKNPSRERNRDRGDR
jgi:hypothetical protein